MVCFLQLTFFSVEPSGGTGQSELHPPASAINQENAPQFYPQGDLAGTVSAAISSSTNTLACANVKLAGTLARRVACF